MESHLHRFREEFTPWNRKVDFASCTRLTRRNIKATISSVGDFSFNARNDTSAGS